MNLGPAARRYIGLLCVAAVAALVFALEQDRDVTYHHGLLFVTLTALGTLAWLFPLRISFKTHLFLDTSIVIMAILTLEPELAILAAGTWTAIAHRFRHYDGAQTLFNTAQIMLQTAAGAAILSLGGWDMTQHHYDRASLVLIILLAGIAITLIADSAVATMVALQTRVQILPSLSQAIVSEDATERLAQLGQIGIGIIGAILIQSYPWTLVLLFIPAVAVYFSLQKAIEHRTLVEAALRDTEAALVEAQRVAHLGSWDWNLDSGVQAWSDEAFRILGYEPKEFLPTWNIFLRCIHPDDRTAVDRAIHEALYTGERFSLDHRIVRPGGGERIVQAQGEVLFDSGGKKERVVGTFQDVTERKNAERAREALLASVSHDLKSPLTVIRGHAQLLQLKSRRSGTNSVELGDGLAKIDAAANRMAAQLTELLDVARLQMGEELELQREPFDLVALVRDRVNVHLQTTRRHEIAIRSSEDRIAGEWDKTRLERVLDNLIGNALKYSPTGGGVSVEVRSDRNHNGAWAVVAVSDEGVGIPVADLPNVFSPFQRGGNVGMIPGTGVGLAGARQIIEQHGGSIEVDSAEGKGSTFTIRLPCRSSVAGN